MFSFAEVFCPHSRIEGLAVDDVGNGVIVGDSCHVLLSSDRGETWTEHIVGPVSVSLRAVTLVQGGALIAVTPAPCVIWPIEGRFALPSSALAAGALVSAACSSLLNPSVLSPAIQIILAAIAGLGAAQSTGQTRNP